MKVLLLAGTAEARILAGLLGKAGVDATASLSGATKHPESVPIKTRIGGFGGCDNQYKYIKDNGFDAVIDATHPFASDISNRTAQIAAKLKIPCLHLIRPPWERAAGDNWIQIPSAQAAAQHIPQNATVFLATGRQTLPAFENLRNRRVICRVIDPPQAAFPYKNGAYVIGKPPFSIEDEAALFKAHGINWLVVKNSGGSTGRTKLDAARELGLPVLIIKRPDMPKGPTAKTPSQAMQWLNDLHGVPKVRIV